MRRLILLAVLIVLPALAYAQGCTQCRDNAAATPPRTQVAYRHAIVLLVAAAGAIFGGTLLVLKRTR